tara:strand:+ start:810 stop:980 length:171 start_codon:yes stop_codon:yes gene_type:complete
MKLSSDHIQEFIKLYEKRYGVTLSKDEALSKAIGLCRLVEIVVVERNENEYGGINT